MFEKIRIENYKSIEKIDLELGRINVFIGENGAGKSNIFEAIALAGAAQARKLDNEFLASRGIRVSGPKLMRSAFEPDNATKPIIVSTELAGKSLYRYVINNDNQPYSKWFCDINNHRHLDFREFFKFMDKNIATVKTEEDRRVLITQLKERLLPALKAMNESEDASKFLPIELEFRLSDAAAMPAIDGGGISNFIVYSPENSSLRTFEREGQIEPLGINGEGLLKLLSVMSRSKNKHSLDLIRDSLRLFNWFDDVKITRTRGRGKIEIFDRFLCNDTPFFDERSVNEGFLFLCFYFTLLASDLTPRFFAIDNLDSSLNPKLCSVLMEKICSLAKESDKQILLSTHNPATLDGIDLNDTDVRLFVVSRSTEGRTRVRRFEKKPSSGRPRRLSDLFLSGALGGLPKHF